MACLKNSSRSRRQPYDDNCMMDNSDYVNWLNSNVSVECNQNQQKSFSVSTIAKKNNQEDLHYVQHPCTIQKTGGLNLVVQKNEKQPNAMSKKQKTVVPQKRYKNQKQIKSQSIVPRQKNNFSQTEATKKPQNKIQKTKECVKSEKIVQEKAQKVDVIKCNKKMSFSSNSQESSRQKILQSRRKLIPF